MPPVLLFSLVNRSLLAECWMHLSATVIISAVKYLGKTHPSSVHPARLPYSSPEAAFNKFSDYRSLVVKRHTETCLSASVAVSP